MKKHVTLVCDNRGCIQQIHTGKENNTEARFFASKAYDWASPPDYPKGSGGRHIDLCPECKYIWVRPGEDFPMYTRLMPHELDALQEANLL